MTNPLIQKKCCCGCWYRIPLCPCEDDPEQFPLYIICSVLEDFFDQHPELGNHLVFEFFDGTNFLCYDMQLDPGLKVGILPDNAIELTEPPPPDTWFPPPFDDCIFCCPSPCCPPCWDRPTSAPCCWWPGCDEGVAEYTASAITTVWLCCDGVNTETVECQAVAKAARYEIVACTSVSVLFWWCDGDPCMWTWWEFFCFGAGNPGWSNSLDLACPAECVTTCEPNHCCFDFLPFCCPDEGQECFPFCCYRLSTDDPDHSCTSVSWQERCPYATVIDCPGWDGVDGSTLCACAEQEFTFSFATTLSCDGEGTYPDGLCGTEHDNCPLDPACAP